MRKVAATAVLLFAVAGALQAQPINGAATGLTSPAYTIDFNTSIGPDNTVVTNQYPGLTFSGFYYGNGPYGGGAFPDGALYNFYPCCNFPLTISFANAVNGVAFNFETNPGISTFTAFLNGNQVGQFSGATTITNLLWYGFDNTTLDALVIDPESTTNHAMGLDNLQVGSRAVVTPEPASLVLFGTGLFAIAGIGARRRARG